MYMILTMINPCHFGQTICEFLHIGDTYDCDYICPKENGWNAIYYNKGSVKKIESIKSFIEIIGYLK